MVTVCGIRSIKGSQHHLDEVRHRLLCSSVPLGRESGWGEIYAVIDGVGGFPRGRAAVQHVADRLLDFYLKAEIPATRQGL